MVYPHHTADVFRFYKILGNYFPKWKGRGSHLALDNQWKTPWLDLEAKTKKDQWEEWGRVADLINYCILECLFTKVNGYKGPDGN